MNKRYGISLIMLVITIVVIVILAISVILTLTNNNPIKNAKQAVNANDEVTIKEAAALAYTEWFVEENLGNDTGMKAEEYVEEKLKTQDFSKELINSLTVTDDGKITILKTAKEVVAEMKVGWNLGDTLDCIDNKKTYLGQDEAIDHYETYWKNPKTTKQMIDEVKKAGFNSVRVPVTYCDHIHEDGTIDEKWFQRIEEIVNYVLDNDMYCIMDVHHDTGHCEKGPWIFADADKYEENAEKLSGLWRQIANRFKDYDYKLIFEGFNEIIDTKKDYTWTNTENTRNVNRLNQVFIDTVRETGGNNTGRFLAVSTFSSISDKHKLENFEMPADKVENKIILSLHPYYHEIEEIEQLFIRLNQYCVDKDIPVVITEFGTKSSFADEDQRSEIANYYVLNAKKLGITCFWWDDGKDYILFDRKNLTWKYEKIKDAIISGSNMQSIY